MLSNIKIILVETSHPGNIGAAARAMKNMGLSQLCLVKPKEFPSVQALARASGATDILDKATVVDTLDEALADANYSFACSARDRSLAWPTFSAKAAAEVINQHAFNAAKIAIVFGRESSGLTNSELTKCQYHINIPTNPDYSSLNLAMAVQVIAYEIYQDMQKPRDVRATTLAAPSSELELFHQHLEAALVKLDFLDPKQPKQLLQRLRRLFAKAQPDKQELNILRGILTAIDKNI